MQQTTTEALLTRYGPLMTLNDLAKFFDRSVDGLRISLGRDSEISKQLKLAKVKIGRRIYFKTIKIAEVIDGPDGEDHGRN